MNLSYSVLYSYVLAILASLILLLLTRDGAREGGRRVFPDITLEPYAPARPDGQSDTSNNHLIGKATLIGTDFLLPPQMELSGDFVVKGSLTLGDGARLHGSAKASRSISLGSRVLVVGNLVSESDITIGAGAEVLGVVHARDSVWLMPSSYVSVSVVSGRTVFVYEAARVGRHVSASHGIVHQTSQKMSEEATQRSKGDALIAEPSGRVCHRCRSPLLTFDPLRQQRRCLDCGTYQWQAAGFAPHTWNPDGT